MDRLTEIEQRLERATPAPWVTRNVCGDPADVAIHAPDEQFDIGNVGSFLMPAQGAILSDVERDNADFISNAPTDIAYLLGEVKRLREILYVAKGASQGVIATEQSRILDGQNPMVNWDYIVKDANSVADAMRGESL